MKYFEGVRERLYKIKCVIGKISSLFMYLNNCNPKLGKTENKTKQHGNKIFIVKCQINFLESNYVFKIITKY